MITTILPHRQSSLGAIEYNEQKYWAREAELLGVKNLPSDTTYVIVKTFSRLEAPVFLRSDAKRLSFHMAISPAGDEHLTDEQAMAFTGDLMQGLGYGEQPYVVYRHHDIAREHFHVVSTRATNSGTLVKDNYEQIKLKRLKESLADKYGYHLEAQEDKKKKMNFLFRFDPSRGDFTRQCAQLYDMTTDYCYRSRDEFACLMKDLGVDIRFVEDKERNFVTLQGTDEGGQVLMPPVSEMKIRRIVSDIVDQTAEYYAKFDFDGKFENGRSCAMANVSLLLQHSPDKESFRRSMRSKGLAMMVTRDPSGGRELMFVCHDQQCVLTEDDLGRNFSQDLLRAAELRWGEEYEDDTNSIGVGRTHTLKKIRTKQKTREQLDSNREVSERIRNISRIGR